MREAINAVPIAVYAELHEHDDPVALRLLQRELQFFIARKGEYEEGGKEDDLDALDAGQTIKDSAEDLIKKLPRWLRHLLKILNELISIIRGGG